MFEMGKEVQRATAEQLGSLSPAERAFIPEAEARAREASKRAAEAASKAAARKILREELADCYWDELRAHPMRGHAASRLLGVWEEVHVDEPITECADEVRDLLKTTMSVHGSVAWDEACRMLGEAIASRAIEYVLDTHGHIDADECFERDA